MLSFKRCFIFKLMSSKFSCIKDLILLIVHCTKGNWLIGATVVYHLHNNMFWQFFSSFLNWCPVNSGFRWIKDLVLLNIYCTKGNLLICANVVLDLHNNMFWQNFYVTMTGLSKFDAFNRCFWNWFPLNSSVSRILSS